MSDPILSTTDFPRQGRFYDTHWMGVVVARQEIHDTFMAAGGADHMLEFPHGYTYSAHPIACAAGIATLDERWRDL